MDPYLRRFTFARIDIHESYARFFIYESADKVLSYARLNCAVFNYFYMSLGQVKHTIVVCASSKMVPASKLVLASIMVLTSLYIGPDWHLLWCANLTLKWS